MSNIEKGFIQVDDLHRIYYRHSGNISGKTVLFLHGGPGLGSTYKDPDFFDLNDINLIQFDQRGCGISTPRGMLVQNTTQHLLADIDRLLDQLNIGRAFLFGGSWGSTLALLYGINRPDRVEGLILRGVFTATKAERAFFENGGTRWFFPEAWRRFIRLVPATERDEPSNWYFRRILSGNSSDTDQLANELMRYGSAVANKDRTSPGSHIKKADLLNDARILSHYSINDFFIPDGYIWENTKQLNGIPVHIVQGRFDLITPPKTAIELAAALPNCQLHLVDGGHSPFDPEIGKKLKEVVSGMVNW